MRRIAVATILTGFLWPSVAPAEYRITKDYGGSVESYKAKYAIVRDRGERVVIDGICNSSCTLVLGIVPRERICVTARAVLGLHMPYYDLASTGGVKVVSYQATADFMAHYPEALRKWLGRQGGLTQDIKELRSGPDLWAVVPPCSGELF